MIRKYLLTKRNRILPWVKDWTDAQDHIRFNNNVNTLTYEEWFWCHPSAYVLIQYGIYVIGFITYLVAGLVLDHYNFLWIAYINYVLAALMIFLIYKKKEEMKHTKGFTFYDMYLRDFEVKL